MRINNSDNNNSLNLNTEASGNQQSATSASSVTNSITNAVDTNRNDRLTGQFAQSRGSMEAQLVQNRLSSNSGSWRAIRGLGSRSSQDNLVQRPGNRQPGNFIDRPTGQRPGAASTSSTPTAVTTNGGPRAEQTVTISKTATPNLAVKDNTTTTSTITIDEDVKVENLSLSIDLPHSYRGDLVVKLTSPSGKTVTLTDRQGGSADDVKGKFDLSQFAGEQSKGEWKLTVEDKARVDEGTLKSWGLDISGKKAGGPGPVDPPKPNPNDAPIVVVLDGGVDARHTDLDSAMWVNAGEVAGDGVDNDGNGIVDDVNGFNVGFNSGDVARGEGNDHGTHVAGIIAAEDNNVGVTGTAAGKAKILAIGGLYDGADLLTNFERSVDYVVDMKQRGNNIRVINASFGDAYRSPADQARWNAAIKKLADNDILLVAATANGNGSNMNNVPDFPANADFPNVLTVASMDRRNDKLARFSSHGDKVVDLAAVGEDVLSTVPGNRFETMSGTSMATPKVAATAALIFAQNPNLTAVQAREFILASVDFDQDLVGKVITKGKLNTQAAVAAAAAANA